MKNVIILLLAIILVGCNSKKIDEKSTSQNSENNPLKTVVDANIEKTNKIENKNVKVKNNKDERNIVHNILTTAEYSIPDNLKSMQEHSDAIILARINSELGSKIEVLGDRPFTTYNVDVIEKIKGEDFDDNIDINYAGGVVTLKEYKEYNFPEANEKEGLDKLTDEELESRYVSIYPEEYTELEIGNIYLIFLFKEVSMRSGNEEYYVLIDGLSVYEPSFESNDIVVFSENSIGSEEVYNKHNERVLTLDEVRKSVTYNE